MQERPDDTPASAHRTTIMTIHNGGASTRCEMRPVTVQRVAANDNHDEDDYAAGLVVNDYSLRQVAA